MTQSNPKCLILACGNTLRSDDGIGPWLAQWAEEKFQNDARIRVISRQQWTPDLAEDISQARNILFIDSSLESEPGSVQIRKVSPSAPGQGIATHHESAAELLTLAQSLYGYLPAQAMQLTIGAGSIDLGERFSEAVLGAVAKACASIEETIAHLP